MELKIKLTTTSKTYIVTDVDSDKENQFTVETVINGGIESIKRVNFQKGVYSNKEKKEVFKQLDMIFRSKC